MPVPEKIRLPQLPSQFTGMELIDSLGDLPTMSEPPAPTELPVDALSTLTKGAGAIAESLSPATQLNQEYLSRNKDVALGIQKATGISNVVSSIASKLGPVGMIASAGLNIGSALSKSATDEFGVVKDSGKAIIGGILNPIEGIGNLLNQKKLRESRNAFVNTEIASKKAENQVAGNKITNSIPKYVPPAYGRFGRKLTKFTK